MTKGYPQVKTTSFLGENTELDGTLWVKGGLRVDGLIKGAIHSESVVTLGESAVVKADIHARAVISSGRIEGDIKSADLVQVALPGTIKGAIETRELVLERGVYFDGSCKIVEPEA